MQRVVRSTLLGLLTIAGLTACGDKVTVTNPPTPVPPTPIVHNVTVSPSAASVQVGGTFTFAASVDADAGISSRTVTWSSSDATVATVDGTGKVTGVKAGTVSIKATSVADPTVSGAAALTVGPASGGGAMSVQIVSVLQNVGAGVEQPANVAGAFGQLDVLVNVDPNGQTLKTVSVTLKVGNDSLVQTQTFTSNAVPVSGEASASVLTFSFNTAAFNATTGVPAIHNGTMTITATATSTTSTTPSASSTVVYTLANVDGVVITDSFTAITNAEGVTQPTTATDAFGLPWRSGSVTVLAVPVLYSGRTISSVTITLPGATNPQFTTGATPPYSNTWSGSASSGTRVTGLTLVDPNGLLEVNGTTPKGITPSVIALDAAGNDLGLGVLNAGIINNSTFRLDNTPPEAPLAFNIPARQADWVNASYVFTGVGAGTGGGSINAVTGTENFISCGDGPNVAQSPYVCQPQVGVSATSNLNTIVISGVAGTSNPGSSNGNTTFTYYAIPTASYVSASGTNGTSTSATSCSTAGWTKITTAGDLAATLQNTSYAVRVFESDKLLNARCTDLAKPPATTAALGTMINTGVAGTFTANADKFGVDKVAPTAVFDEPATVPSAASANMQVPIGAPTPNFTIGPIGLPSPGAQDDASGFSATPVTTKLLRVAIDPATGAQGSLSSAFGCPISFSNSSCGTGERAFVLAADGGTGADASGCVGCGYFTYTGTVHDRALNNAAPLTRTVVIDRMAPTMGSIAVPSQLNGGQPASFATSANDNLDLISYDYTLNYPNSPANNPAAAGGTLAIRTPSSQATTFHAAFSGTLVTTQSFNLSIPQFIRSIAVTSGAGAPPAVVGTLPNTIAARTYDAAGNPSVVNNLTGAGFSNIPPASIVQTNQVNFSTQAAQPGATMTSFTITNAITNISNCSGCTAANPTTVTLTASVSGNEGANFIFANPFTQVQFYYFDTTVNEYILIGTTSVPSVSDNGGATIRTYNFSLATPWDPPASLGPLAPGNFSSYVVAIGVTASGDALATPVSPNIVLTNP